LIEWLICDKNRENISEYYMKDNKQIIYYILYSGFTSNNSPFFLILLFKNTFFKQISIYFLNTHHLKVLSPTPQSVPNVYNYMNYTLIIRLFWKTIWKTCIHLYSKSCLLCFKNISQKFCLLFSQYVCNDLKV